ncbi:hypothetical protein [Burkholderia sp. Ac-20353]|uniref:glycine-rich domain-containing protein n=1 Tax=Burkholderia sp. Ac-20353 TaxID=2703894 RepID=UPI00197B6D06|nr:hypothetical protein [Burkholderia sp. Ac-20353]MBN3788307.1 hypothetical protein [Burkholderia sp. Ac-20353]
MTQYVIDNNINTTLASALPSSSTTIVLANSANLPTLSAGQIMPITLNDTATGQLYEIVYVTAISGTSLTVIRAQEGTGALAWNVGDYAYCAFTAGTTAASTGNPSNTFQVAPATQSQHAMQLGQANGRLLRTTIYTNPSGTQLVSVNGGTTTSTGATTFNALALTTLVDVEVLSAGGAGGGAVATGASTCSAGSGGNSGTCGRSIFTSGFSGTAITVGAGGTANAGAAGNNGGSSSFGALLSCPGGAGGTSTIAGAPPILSGSPAATGSPSGTNVISASSNVGSVGLGFSSSSLIGGNGAGSIFGGEGLGGFASPGTSASGPGAGGGGSVNTFSQSAKSAGAGFGGIVIVREYA